MEKMNANQFNECVIRLFNELNITDMTFEASTYDDANDMVQSPINNGIISDVCTEGAKVIIVEDCNGVTFEREAKDFNDDVFLATLFNNLYYYVVDVEELGEIEKWFAEALKDEITKEFKEYCREYKTLPDVAYVKVQWYDADEPERDVQTIAIYGSAHPINDDEILFYCDGFESLLHLVDDSSIADFRIVSFVGFGTI